MSKYELDYGDHTETVCGRLGLLRVWVTEINKAEYPNFDDWLADMKRNGLVTEIREAI